jgi:hypothetical protein
VTPGLTPSWSRSREPYAWSSDPAPPSGRSPPSRQELIRRGHLTGTPRHRLAGRSRRSTGRGRSARRCPRRHRPGPGVSHPRSRSGVLGVKSTARTGHVAPTAPRAGTALRARVESSMARPARPTGTEPCHLPPNGAAATSSRLGQATFAITHLEDDPGQMASALQCLTSSHPQVTVQTAPQVLVPLREVSA